MPFFLLVIVVLFFGLLAPASADFKKVNERELARANASLTGQPGTILCPDPADANQQSDCVAVPTEKKLLTDAESLSSVYEDYGYDWWKNLSVAGDPDYYEDSSVLSAVTVESGRDGGYGASSSEEGSVVCQKQILGSLHLDGLKVKTNGNTYVTLYKSDSQMGVSVNVDATIDRIDLATFSWGDGDGFGDASGAGYVGLKNTSITGVTASGSLAISVAKEDAAVNYNSVHVGIDSLDVSMSSLDTTVVLGDRKNFSGTRYVLGTLYMKNLEMNVGGYLNIYKPADKDVATSLKFGLDVPLLMVDTLSWGDPDGYDGAGNAGYIGLRRLAISNLAIAGVATVEKVCVQSGDARFNVPAGTALVRLEFANLNVGMGSLDSDVALGSSKDNLNQVLGHIYLGGLNANIDGTVDIHAPSPSTQGIVFDLDLRVALHPFTLSWGNTDGFGTYGGATTTAGYVGLRNLAISGLTVSGRVGIDVATASYETHNMRPTFVHIGLGTGNSDPNPANMNSPDTLAIRFDSLTTDVVLDRTKTLNSDSSGTLGSIYISGVSYRVNGWVDIGAH